MKRKRRKKLTKAWNEFQAEHELSDVEVELAKSAGYPLDRLVEKLTSEAFCALPIRQAISLMHSQHEQMLAERRAAIAAGSQKPRVKKKKGFKQDPEWVKAKRLCRLNQDDIRKAKELGMKPKSLIKNIPSPNQQWKLSVKNWIAELYEKRLAGKTARVQLTISMASHVDKEL